MINIACYIVGFNSDVRFHWGSRYQLLASYEQEKAKQTIRSVRNYMTAYTVCSYVLGVGDYPEHS
ncbi:hypothetical protein PS726_00409 [Pseudomonas fluorescens]|nr:hypothetical protein PS726_00409 [Pseudomonas fluorescens]